MGSTTMSGAWRNFFPFLTPSSTDGGKKKNSPSKPPSKGKAKKKSPTVDVDAHIAELRTSAPTLTAFLLSSAAAPPQHTSGSEVTELPDGEILECLRRHVEGLDSLRARDGETSITVYLLATYKNGLPLFKDNPAVQAQLVTAIRVIFSKVKEGCLPERVSRDAMTRLAEAFTACQAVQGRVIDTLYGELSGRDKGFRDQMLVLVDELKERVLEEVANTCNPDAWRQGDECPEKQLPHILSSYRVSLGEAMGLPGVEAARCDHCARPLSAAAACEVATLLFQYFDEAELLHEIVKDVNQPGSVQDRRINRTQLAKWVGAEGPAHSFDPHRVYWDESHPEAYDGRPADGEEYEPFINPEVASEVLHALFLAPGETEK